MVEMLKPSAPHRHAGWYMVPALRFPFALIAGSVALLGAIGCPPKQQQAARPPEPVLLPAVASIEIVPAYVSVPAGTSFTLQAQLKDSWGTTLSDSRNDSVSWQITQGVSVSSGPKSSSVVVNAFSVQSAAPTITVVASLNGASATNTIGVVSANPQSGATPTSGSAGNSNNPPTVSAPDRIRAPHVAANLPTIALIDGTSGGAQRNDSTFAFAESRELASFNCSAVSMCGEITIFSPTLGIRRDTVGWKGGCDYADFKGGGGTTGPSLGCPAPFASAQLIPIPPRVHVPVVIWQASNSQTVDNLIVQDTAYLLSVFNQPWTGLTLDVTINIAYAAVSLTYDTGCNDPAADITNQLLDAIPGSEITPDRITVAYVDDISGGWISAFACPYDTSEGSVILISKGGVGASTLAHEFGHALGQWFSEPIVHVDGIPGFEESNVLWSNESGETRSIRKHLTLGQLFQMSLRDGSFVKRSPTSTVKGLWCPPIAESETPCPGLAKDVVR